MASTDDRITDLEIQIAHQARTIEELSDEMARRSKEIDTLKARVAALIDKARDVDAMMGEAPAADQKPPHW